MRVSVRCGEALQGVSPVLAGGTSIVGAGEIF